MTIEEEELSTLTGLSEYIVLDTTRDISMPWQDKILYQLIHIYDCLPPFCHEQLNTEQKLLSIGFSQQFIYFLRLKISLDESFILIDDLLYILIYYAVDVVYNNLPLHDKNGFPQSLECEDFLLNHWTKDDIPFFLYKNFPHKLVFDSSIKWYFHPTDWNMAIGTLKYGIDVSSCKYSRYSLYDDFEIAIKIGRTLSVGYMAILCYHYEEMEYINDKTKIAIPIQHSYCHDYKSYDIIKGTMAIATNPSSFSEIDIQHDLYCNQMDIKSYSVAEKMTKSLKSVVFFSST